MSHVAHEYVPLIAQHYLCQSALVSAQPLLTAVFYHPSKNRKISIWTINQQSKRQMTQIIMAHFKIQGPAEQIFLTHSLHCDEMATQKTVISFSCFIWWMTPCGQCRQHQEDVLNPADVGLLEVLLPLENFFIGSLQIRWLQLQGISHICSSSVRLHFGILSFTASAGKVVIKIKS